MAKLITKDTQVWENSEGQQFLDHDEATASQMRINIAAIVEAQGWNSMRKSDVEDMLMDNRDAFVKALTEV